MKTRAIKFLAVYLFSTVALSTYHAHAAAGDLDLSFNPGSGTDGYGYAVITQPDGKVLVWGPFKAINGVSRSGIARLNADGSLDASFDPGTGVSDAFSPLDTAAVASIAVQPDGKVVIAGDFTKFNGVPRAGAARLNPDGSLDNSFNVGGPYTMGWPVVVQPDGKLIFGGVRLNADGSLDTIFWASLPLNSAIFFPVLQSDGKVLLVGNFGIIRFNHDGSVDTTFNSDIRGWVFSVASLPDSKVLVGGYLYTGNGTNLGGIARLNADGSLDTSFIPYPGIWGAVNHLALQQDGKVLIAGCFLHISRLNDDGSLDTGFRESYLGWCDCYCVDNGGPVGSVAVQPDGKVLIGGTFTSVNGTPRPGLARLIGGPSDRPPVADASATKLVWVAPNGSNAVVTLDASRSFDPDGDPLQYSWSEFRPMYQFTNGVVAEMVLPVGTSSIQLWVSDGSLWNTTTITIEVLTKAQAVNRLIAVVNSEVARPQPLRATLSAVIDSFGRGDPMSAAKQLVAFQQQVRAQVAPSDPALAERLIQAAQYVVDALATGKSNR